MLSVNRKLKIFSAFATLVLLAAAVGCRGFFQDPSLTGITVGPASASIQQGKTLQMTATGTFNDGSTKTLTGNVIWTTSDSTIATVSSSGLVTGVAAGTATITASSGTATGSTTVMITLTNLISIMVTPNGSTVTGSGVQQQFTATGNFSSGSQDITTQVQWSVSPTTAASISNTAGSQGLLTTMAVTAPTTVTVTATSGTVAGSATLTINP